MLAAGAWTGQLMAEAGLASGLRQPGSRPGAADAAARWAAAFQPRRGHLLELGRPAGMAPLSAGLMEAGYAKARVFRKFPDSSQSCR